MNNLVAQGGPVVKSPKHVVSMLVVLALAAVLSGCSKNTTPTGPDPALDQAAPAIPAQITADIDLTTDSAELDWTASSSANAASYEIYQYLPCPQSEDTYVIVGRTDAATTSYQLPWAPTPTTLYYRLRTVSSTGVKSALSAPVLVTVGDNPGGDPDDPVGIMRKVKP
jgi:hypothetical protein